jgi:transcriptional regulator with XRE-family HTH domain
MLEKFSIDYVAVGEKIRHKRVNMKLSQATVSEKTELSESFYGHIERGERIPSIDSLVRIAKFLDISLDYLLLDSIDSAIDKKLQAELDNVFRDKSPEQTISLLNILKVLSDGIDRL